MYSNIAGFSMAESWLVLSPRLLIFLLLQFSTRVGEWNLLFTSLKATNLRLFSRCLHLRASCKITSKICRQNSRGSVGQKEHGCAYLSRRTRQWKTNGGLSVSYLFQWINLTDRDRMLENNSLKWKYYQQFFRSTESYISSFSGEPNGSL